MHKRTSAQSRIHSRLRAFGLGCTLIILVVFCWALPAMAQSEITWDDLQSQSTHLKNPYEELTKEQTYRLSSLYQLKEWVKGSQTSANSFEVKEIQRLEQSFVDEGLDTSKLLSHVEDARAYLQSQSTITNPDLEGRLVKLSGYVLPLNETKPAQANQWVNEFLLVPFVGACIHVPPPPPNQIIHIQPGEAIEYPGLFSSVLVTGTLRKDVSNYELFQVDGSRTVDVSYAMDMESLVLAPNATTPKITGAWWKTIPARVSNILTVSLGNLSRQTSPQTMALAILFSFGYGVLHTLGPGHGKAVIVSYFVGHNGSLKRGMAMGTRIAIFHVFSAVVIAILTHTILQQLGANGAGSYRIIRLISYGAIAILGGRMLRQALISQNRSSKTIPSSTRYSTAVKTNALNGERSDSLLSPSLSQQIAGSTINPPMLADCQCLTCDDRRGIGGWLALAVGAVPCSGALLVLLYGLANNLLWPSVAMVISISVGMACTLGWIGAMAIIGNRYGQQLALRRWKRLPRSKRLKNSRFSLMLSGQIIGACCVSLLGVGLFCATLITP